ncbi:MAG: MAE_28990/MAE_18760 family HEPN-like nuclease [Nostoc sp. DedQUE12b]|uniref:MAE_28990/MAE_18760 family HEPN-like nuclease n=1 Tax=Nostoc sp. DedQUE12b TaxID=3075398 RepID=UPI002AD21F61|nr:MAE_28990/MAE_18760 family HEPN-like nuclease [Nostoc sp. DedQUE12b]MDZ8088781.1 MAE_28990/MAE_18760 family HEPN-like nuclease [Nostoc sp. DedQUE12b]
MTVILFQDFNERTKEVSKYFIFLKSLEQGSTKLSMEGINGKNKIRRVDSDLEKTLKASSFLLLYNLVESTMRNAIETIFEEIRGKGISFDQVRPEIKKIVLRNLKKRNSDKIILSITAISLDIITAGFDKEDLFSGNIDGRLIREMATDYGFSHITDYVKTGNGSDLLTVKSNRNDLAHGIKSFAEVGRDKSADELLKIKKQVVMYLRAILLNIETYLVNKEYLDSSTGSP